MRLWNENFKSLKAYNVLTIHLLNDFTSFIRSTGCTASRSFLSFSKLYQKTDREARTLIWKKWKLLLFNFSQKWKKVFNGNNGKPYRMDAQQRKMENESYSSSALFSRSYCDSEHCLHIKSLFYVVKEIFSLAAIFSPHSPLFYATFHSSRRLIALAMKQVSSCYATYRYVFL